jgi:hypothetical protein
MTCCNNDYRVDLCVAQGKTFQRVLRWGREPYQYRTVEAVTRDGALRLKSTAHGIPDGWMVALNGLRGMPELNARNQPPSRGDLYKATLIDADTIELNEISGARYGAWRGGGDIQFLSPVNVTGMSARMDIRSHRGDLLFRAEPGDGRLTVDAALHGVVMRLPQTDTSAFDWACGVYEIEISDGTDVFMLAFGEITVKKEVTIDG